MGWKLREESDKIPALMVAGSIKATGKAKEVLQPELIAEAYCLPVQVIPHPFLDVPLVLPDNNPSLRAR